MGNGEFKDGQRYTGSSAFMETIKELVNGRSYLASHFMLAEECGELTQAVSKMVRHIEETKDDRRNKKDNAFKYIELADHILEESADVIICICTLLEIYGFSADDMDVAITRKMVRNMARIKNEQL